MLTEGCKYKINIGKEEVTFNLMQLTNHYYKNTSRLLNTNIFSSDEVVESVLAPIEEQMRRKNAIISDSTKTPVGVYIPSANNSETYTKYSGITINQLVPEYNEDNRILNYVRNQLIATEIYVRPLKENEDAVGYLETILKNNPSGNKFDKDIRETINIENNSKYLGIGIHDILSQLISEKGNFTKRIENNLKEVIRSNNKYLEGSENQWFSKFSDILENIYKNISSNNQKIITELNLASEPNAPAQVSGKLDIVTIDDAGRVHIYDLKLSKNSYKDWDSAKLITTDWQLAFYRALLGQYVRVDDASLNIIPIQLGHYNSNGKIDLDNVLLEDRINRITENSGKELMAPYGKLYKLSKALIPNTTNIEHDPIKLESVKADLGILFPKFDITTSKRDYDFETILNSAVKNHGFVSDFPDFNDTRAKTKENLIYINSNEGNHHKSDNELKEEYTPIVKNYVDFAEKDKNANLIVLRDKIIQSIEEGGTHIKIPNETENLILNNLVGNYTNGEYRVTRGSEALSSLGIILLQNKSTNAYVALNITSHNQRANYDNEHLMEHVEAVKCMLFFNHYKDSLDLNSNPIQKILIYSSNKQNVQTPYEDTYQVYDIYENMMNSKGLTNNLSKNKNILSIEKLAVTELKEIQRNSMNNMSDIDRNRVKKIVDKYPETFEDISLGKLKVMARDFIREFPELSKQTLKSGFNFGSNIEQLFAMVQTLLLIKSEQVPIGDFMGMKNFNIQFSSLNDMFTGVFSKNRSTYDINQSKVGSIMEGLKTITPDRIGSKDFQNINLMIEGTNSFITQDYYLQSTKINMATKAYYDAIKRGKFEQDWVGNHQKVYEDFWLKDAGGKISTQWKTKNPYSAAKEDSLTDSQRVYLKTILFEINKRRLGLTKEEMGKIDFTSEESMQKTSPSAYTKIQKALVNGEYFKMGLIRSQQANRYSKYLHEGIAGISDDIRAIKKELVNVLDSRELDDDETRKQKRDMGYYEMYDNYTNQSDKFKETVLTRDGVDSYMHDLDAIANRMTFNQIRKEYLDNILPIIGAYTWWMKLTAGKQDQDISKELEYVTNRIKVGALNLPIIEEEMTDFVKAISIPKKVVMTGLLAFRPAIFIRDMIIGTYKGVTLAASKIYGGDQFDIKDWSAAMTKLTTIDNQFTKEWNLIDGINNQYGMANRDINVLPRKMQTNRRGIFMGLGPWMYCMNTQPYYYNRLALFLAKMIHEGSYDAHTLDNTGYLHYDPTKDGRFEYYFKERDKHLNPIENSSVKYLPSKTDEVYNKQRNLYNLITEQRSAERNRVGLSTYKEGDIIDNAYTEQERASYKSFADTVYGYYDASQQAELSKTWLGITYLQFLQFWPAKMNLWFGGNKDARLSPQGHFEQKSKIVDGKKVLLWRDPVYSDETGDIINFNEVENNTHDPALDWIGTPQQGLFNAMLMTAKDVVTMNWSDIKDNELQTRRAAYGLADSVMMVAIFGVISAMVKGWLADHNNDTDAIHYAAEYTSMVDAKVLTQANVWGNTFGAVKSEPAFWTYGTKVSNDMLDIMNGSKNIQHILGTDIKTFEIFNPTTPSQNTYNYYNK